MAFSTCTQQPAVSLVRSRDKACAVPFFLGHRFAGYFYRFLLVGVAH